MWVPGQLELVEAVAAAHPELTVIVDHVGLFQPPHHERGPEPFADLRSLLDLSRFPNVAVKVSGLPTLSQSPFPYPDLWLPLREIVTAFGHDRALWGSDISRVDGRIGFFRTAGAGVDYPGRHNYAQALFYLKECPELSDEEKAWILGETASQLLRWPQ